MEALKTVRAEAHISSELPGLRLACQRQPVGCNQGRLGRHLARKIKLDSGCARRESWLVGVLRIPTTVDQSILIQTQKAELSSWQVCICPEGWRHDEAQLTPRIVGTALLTLSPTSNSGSHSPLRTSAPQLWMAHRVSTKILATANSMLPKGGGADGGAKTPVPRLNAISCGFDSVSHCWRCMQNLSTYL